MYLAFFLFPEETGKTPSAFPLVRDDRSHLNYTMVGLPAGAG
jgi:hypothetical protein